MKMSNHDVPPTVESVTKTIEQFTMYSRRLVASPNYMTFEQELNSLFVFCEQDSVFSLCHKKMLELTADFPVLDDWCNGNFNYNYTIEDPSREFVVKYRILHTIWEKRLNWFNYVCHRLGASANPNENLRKLHEKITSPMVADLQRELKDYRTELQKDMPENKPPTTSQISQTVIHAKTVIQQSIVGDGNTQNASQTIQNLEIDKLFAELVELVKNANLSDADRQDANGTLDDIKEELSKPAPEKSKLQRWLNSLTRMLPTAANITSIAANILTLCAGE